MLLIAILVCIGAFDALALPVEKNIKGTNDESYLLPDNAILPQNYKITLDVSESSVDTGGKTFTGSVEITALVNKDVKEIVLHSVDITIKQGYVRVEDKDGVQYYHHMSFDPGRQFIILELDKKIEKGKTITIAIYSYDGNFQDDMHGFYISSYLQNKVQKHVLTTQFQPTHARKVFPCFDEPKYKATFELTIKKKAQYKVISNTASVEPDHGSGVTEVHFGKTPKMSTYLLAFIVGEFESASSSNPKFNVWSRPDALGQTKTATNYIVKIVQELNRFTGIVYEKYMDKIDMVALPDFSAETMENWGLLNYREESLLADEKLSTNKDIQRVVSSISHQIAHQWFGNLITTEWWSNTWLNEGFARYFEYHTTGNVLKDWEMKDQFVVEQQQSVFVLDASDETTPLTLEVYTPSEVSSHFGSISYNKGASVIRMMEHFLGSDIFQKGLRHYLDKNRLSSTIPTDLWSAFQEVINTNNVNFEHSIEKVMSSWISQKGYPVINVKYRSDGYIELSQERFYIYPRATSDKQSWFVPISYTTSKDVNFKTLKPKLWLTPTEKRKSISIGNDIDFLVVNIQESGYYRVNYDDILWGKLAAVLPEEQGKQIHYMNRAQIVDDVLNLARAGLVDYEVAFDVTDYLATETNYYPWYSAFQAFRFMLQRYTDAENSGKELKLYVKSLMELLIADKEFTENSKETQIEIFNKAAALEMACNLGHEKCVYQAKTLFKKFKNGKAKIPKNLKSIVYCTAIRNGVEADWNFLWKKFGTSNSATEKIEIINALGCSNDMTILRNYLEKSLDPTSGIRKQDAFYVFQSVYTGSSKGVDVAFNFWKYNSQNMINKYNGLHDLEKAVLGLAARLTDETKITEFKTLLEFDKNFETFRYAANEILYQNDDWTKRYSRKIDNILYEKRTNSAAGIMANKYVVILLGFISIYFSMFK